MRSSFEKKEEGVSCEARIFGFKMHYKVLQIVIYLLGVVFFLELVI